MLKDVRERPVVVGLAGPSGAGKTVFSQKIKHFVPGCCVLSMDMYNRGDLVVDGNFDDPRLTDYDLLLENLQELKAGKPVQSPVYDFKTSSRVGWRAVEPPSVVILEGIYALNNRLRPQLDLRVSIRGGVHLDLVKRVLRDVQRSGQEPEAIINQISETVFPMYKAFIEPDLQAAQLRIVNRFNPFHGFHNPTFILKSDRQVTEDQIRACLSSNVSVEIAGLDDIYLLPPGEHPRSCQTWLRMRNRDGRYTLMFEEYVTDWPFIVSPRVKFEVSVRVLGGLMALGYEMYCVMRRYSKLFDDGNLQVKLVDIEGMGRTFVQVQGGDRSKVYELGSALGLDGRYLSSAYIDLARKEGLTSQFQVSQEYKQNLVRRSSMAALARASSGTTEVQEPSIDHADDVHVPEAEGWSTCDVPRNEKQCEKCGYQRSLNAHENSGDFSAVAKASEISGKCNNDDSPRSSLGGIGSDSAGSLNEQMPECEWLKSQQKQYSQHGRNDSATDESNAYSPGNSPASICTAKCHGRESERSNFSAEEAQGLFAHKEYLKTQLAKLRPFTDSSQLIHFLSPSSSNKLCNRSRDDATLRESRSQRSSSSSAETRNLGSATTCIVGLACLGTGITLGYSLALLGKPLR